MKLNRVAYQGLVNEDLAWLATVPRTLERDHVAAIVRESVDYTYPEPREATAEDVEALTAFVLATWFDFHGNTAHSMGDFRALVREWLAGGFAVGQLRAVRRAVLALAEARGIRVPR